MTRMLSNDTLETDELFTRLTVQLQLSLLMVSTVEGTLLLLLQGISKLQKIVDDKSSWEACHSIGWNRSDLPTVRTCQDGLPLLVLNHQSPKTLLAVDMVALELLGVCVGIEANRTVELVFYLLQSCFSHLVATPPLELCQFKMHL